MKWENTVVGRYKRIYPLFSWARNTAKQHVKAERFHPKAYYGVIPADREWIALDPLLGILGRIFQASTLAIPITDLPPHPLPYDYIYPSSRIPCIQFPFSQF